ncbi:MAG: helix-turn-helix transcriptional regulator [Actinomycetaceae bacterium]|nr:helix-turn-helix transcriptional regulator [Actinomycetaceae bacterium]
MGLTQEELAVQLGVNERTVRRWEKNDFTIPEGVTQDLNELYTSFGERVLSSVDLLLEQFESVHDGAGQSRDDPDGRPVVEIATFKTPESHELAHPGESWTQHKALVSAIGMVLAGEGFSVRFTSVTEQ